MTSMQIQVSAQNVRKTYGKTEALKNATLDLYKGEILALLGPNGAGKTTLIKILATLLAKDSGQVKVLGLDLDKHEKEIRYLFGYVGQDSERSAYARLTATENLRFFGFLRGLSKARIEYQIEKLATDLDFEPNLNKQFMHLSGGQKQAVVIMRALLHDPPVVYLDEPTKGLDPIVAKKTRAFLKQYAHEEGKTLLLTTHILSEVEQLADRVALINAGEVEIVASPQSLKAAVGASEFVEVQGDGLPQSTINKIAALDSVLFSVTRESNWVSFGVTNLLNGTEAIIGVLRQDDVYAMLRHRTVSLEDAFLHHIGKLEDRFD